ncbi:hypothetical protein ACSF6F_00020 [Escherichia coli]|uniref:hypothetical protein n=1 Tax=Escherichia coli TaxID=562 RepID=UPI003EE8AD63
MARTGIRRLEPRVKKSCWCPTGQVEDDALYLPPARYLFRTNRDLLRTVRQRNPEAFIAIKPRPDVLVGNRKGMVDVEDVARWADCQALDADIIQCIQHADELHCHDVAFGF